MNDKNLLQELISLRRKIHRNPELGNSEFKTAALIEKVLDSLHIPHKRVAKTGVVGILRPQSKLRNSKSKCIALRADMDALPLTERGTKSYRSKNPGIMHACGHDAHVAMLLGAAMILSKKSGLKGTVKFLFQPNEEGAGGAKSLIAGGVMKNPAVNAVVALHVNPRLPAGTIGLKEGPLMAAVDRFTVELFGEGGHAAYPHEGKDAIVIASELVQSLQTIASRKVDPLEPVVITVGTINGGTRFNILAEKAVLTGTVRTLSEKLHAKIPHLIRQTAEGVCRAYGAGFELRYEKLGSVLSNSKPMIELARKAAEKCFGRGKIRELKTASMGGEDFAEYLKFSPGCFIYIGTGNQSLGTHIPWHHPAFDLDEKALSVGAHLLAEISQEFLFNFTITKSNKK